MLRCFINHFYCRIRGIVSLRYDRRNVCIPPRRWWDLCRRRTGSWHHLHSYRRRLRFPRRFHIRSLVIAPRQSDCRDCYQQRNQQRVMPRGIDHVDGVVVAVGVEMLRPGVEGGAGVGILREEARRGRVVVAGVHVQQARGVRNAPRERHLVEERIAAGRRHAVAPGGGRMRLPPGDAVFSDHHAVGQGAAAGCPFTCTSCPISPGPEPAESQNTPTAPRSSPSCPPVRPGPRPSSAFAGPPLSGRLCRMLTP